MPKIVDYSKEETRLIQGIVDDFGEDAKPQLRSRIKALLATHRNRLRALNNYKKENNGNN